MSELGTIQAEITALAAATAGGERALPGCLSWPRATSLSLGGAIPSYEINPLECPKCKSEMRIVAFVQDPVEIKKIMQSLGLPDFRAPPPLPIASDELYLDQTTDYGA